MKETQGLSVADKCLLLELLDHSITSCDFPLKSRIQLLKIHEKLKKDMSHQCDAENTVPAEHVLFVFLA